MADNELIQLEKDVEILEKIVKKNLSPKRDEISEIEFESRSLEVFNKLNALCDERDYDKELQLENFFENRVDKLKRELKGMITTYTKNLIENKSYLNK